MLVVKPLKTPLPQRQKKVASDVSTAIPERSGPPTSRTAEAIRQAKADHHAALIGFLPAGFPHIDESVAAGIAVLDAGFDMLEVGIPYSDPVMDGEVIQAATQEVLDSGFKLKHVFEVVSRITQARPEKTVVCMTYWNPILRYGVEKFSQDISQAGAAGLITPDLIPDEAGQWIEQAAAHQLDRIFLVAPSSTPERLSLTAKAATGFVYAASTMGVTGARAQVGDHAKQLVEDTRKAGAEFVCLGLGVSNAEQVREIASYADGVIIGSALIKALNSGGVPAVSELAQHLRTGLDF